LRYSSKRIVGRRPPANWVFRRMGRPQSFLYLIFGQASTLLANLIKLFGVNHARTGAPKFGLMLAHHHHPLSFGLLWVAMRGAHWIILIRICLETPFSYVCSFSVKCSIGIIAMRLPANINRLRNTARWTPLAFWFLDTQILHSTIHRSLSLDSYFDKQESWGTSFLISLFPDHPMTLSWSCRRVRPSGANQNTSDKVRLLGIVILISHSPEYPMTQSWRCKTVRPTGQTITQLHSTLDSLNWFLGVSIAVERVFAPDSPGGRGKSFLIPNISSLFFFAWSEIWPWRSNTRRYWQKSQCGHGGEKRNKRVKVSEPANVSALWSLNLHY
jgi:hypothetical protein